MNDEQANIDEPQTSVRAPDASAAPIGAAVPAEPVFERDDGWLDDREELPPRPRRRLLTPLPLALLAALAIACGFIAGVLVEKGQGDSSSTGAGAGLASRFAAAGRTGSTSSSGLGSAGVGTRGAASGASGAGGAGSTVGQVAYVSKGALYVTTLEGNTVKVTVAPGATVTKSVKTTASAIHPGETVVVTGSAGANGAIAAQSIRAGAAGGLTGGGAGLFGGAGARTSATGAGGSGASGGSGGSGGEQALFGKG